MILPRDKDSYKHTHYLFRLVNLADMRTIAQMSLKCNPQQAVNRTIALTTVLASESLSVLGDERKCGEVERSSNDSRRHVAAVPETSVQVGELSTRLENGEKKEEGGEKRHKRRNTVVFG